MKARTQHFTQQIVPSISIEDLYPDKFDVDESEDEYEYEPVLNLGAESIAPTPPPEPSDDGSHFPATFALPASLSRRKSRSLLRGSQSETQCCGRRITDRLDTISNPCPFCGSHDAVAISATSSSFSAGPSHLRLTTNVSPQDSESSHDSCSSSTERDSYTDSEPDLTQDTAQDHQPRSLASSAFATFRNSSSMDPELARVLGKAPRRFSFLCSPHYITIAVAFHVHNEVPFANHLHLFIFTYVYQQQLLNSIAFNVPASLFIFTIVIVQLPSDVFIQFPRSSSIITSLRYRRPLQRKSISTLLKPIEPQSCSFAGNSNYRL
ncbi:hypothetical protein BDP27DRAFT_1444836 [Rhodocollybia butyracea]|uniref:Uncharacterized protein n=1 Tax=Rhodocollybia butyracea TaxID=206335 RepID=A0A9P5Q279_9AGAR|nr:hypothetical protein BDP27DRAFT_1444836 [Rhodocollybia butyracea]